MEKAAIKKVSFYIIISSLVLLFSGCTLTENDNTITIPLNIPRALISNLGEIHLTVSGSGMNTIELIYASNTDSIEIQVPSGDDREFILLAYLSGENTYPSYRGSAIVDLVPGSSLGIPITMNIAGGSVYVANSGSDSVSVLDGTQNTVLTSIPVGVLPGGVGVNITTGKVYISNASDGTLSVIDTSTNSVVNTIISLTSGSDVHFVAVNSITDRIYVSEYYDGSFITVVDGSTDSIIITVDNNGSYSYGLGVIPSTNKIYSARWNPAAVIDGSTNTYLGDVTLGSWSECGDIGVNPDLNKIYVADQSNDNIHVVDGFTDSETIAVSVGINPYGVGVDVNRNMIYVANLTDGTVSVIDGATNTVIDTITVGTSPMGVAVNSYTSRVYVANSGSNDVSVIDGLTNTVISTIPVETAPYMLEVMPYTK